MGDRPYIFALLAVAVATMITAAIGFWASARPESVVIGLEGRHDGPEGEGRLAACLDCHVPFVGTPASRCLSPGCHGELATGSPPAEGPAMPVRFHAALRDHACGRCHAEHGGPARREGPFKHALIPLEDQKRCVRCHSGARVVHHAPTDAVFCGHCHGTETWRGVQMNHEAVDETACDVCHVAPATPAHASVAGTCSTCHDVKTWSPRVPAEGTEPPVPPPPMPDR